MKRTRIFHNSSKSLGFEAGSADDDEWVRFDVVANGVEIDAFGMVELTENQCGILAAWLREVMDELKSRR